MDSFSGAHSQFADPTGEGVPSYWQKLHNYARKMKAIARHTEVEDSAGGRSIWTVTVMYERDGNIPTWTAIAPNKRDARETAARQALEALGVLIDA